MTEPLDAAAHYYAERLRRFGATPAGADWRDAASQTLRFEQLVKVIAEHDASVLDLGCGYGAFLEFLRHRDFSGAYIGLDVAPEMVAAANERCGADRRARFAPGAKPASAQDYAVASGIFNVRMDIPTERWKIHVDETIADLHRAGRKGFAFNCLTSYASPERMRPDLFYGDPAYYFDLCKRQYSGNVALLHDYGLFEFTILVRKS